MSVLNSKETYKNLKKKGFIDSMTKNIDHKDLEFYFNNKKICETKISHGGKSDIDIHIINKMSKQIFLNNQQFFDFTKCPLTKEDYLMILIEKDLLS
jgi:hypothetical protein